MVGWRADSRLGRRLQRRIGDDDGDTGAKALTQRQRQPQPPQTRRRQ